ncbi:hypothetical protein HS7_10520 [Sulfolobales archaeon HS-7]|nr:hypothetical protein HS7_10520 [Sulfolobales archaeon HS-7]
MMSVINITYENGTSITLINNIPHIPYFASTVISWVVFLFGVAVPLAILLLAIGIRGFIEITRFEKHNTFYYNINAVTKIILLIGVTIAAAITVWWFSAILTIILLASYLTLKNGFRKLILVLYLTLTFIIGITQGFAPYTPYSVLQLAYHTNTFNAIWEWPSYFSFMGYQPYLTLQGLEYGVQISFRFIPATLSGLILILTTTPSEILGTFSRIKVPLAFVFSLIIALRTIPRIFEVFDTVVKLQFMRGLGSTKPKVFYPMYFLYAGIYAVVPTMVYLFRGAKNTAIAADTRAFRAKETITYLNDLTFTKEDIVIVTLVMAILIISGILIALGLGRGIPYTGY